MNYHLDQYFWRLFGLLGIVSALGMLWFKTAKTPLYWTAIVLLRIEAGLRRLWKSTCLACRDFKENYSSDVNGVAADVLGYKDEHERIYDQTLG